MAVAISAQKVFACHVVDGNWKGTKAADFYTNTLGPALHKAYPAKRRFSILEDNDPTGYKSSVAKRAKENLKPVPLEFPNRG